MAHLWQLGGGSGAAADWSPRPLAGDAVAVPPARLLRAAAEREDWVIVGPRAVSVNGSRLDTGIRVLRDRDELRTGSGRLFFSTESLAVVVPFIDTGTKTCCPRCKLEIAPGSPAIRCPRCGVYHHQSEDLPCWTYAKSCSLCDHLTALDAGYDWVPEEL
jgi:hypothetical protein